MAYIVGDVLGSPETAAIELAERGEDGTVVDGFMHIDELALTLSLEDVAAQKKWLETGDAELLGNLAAERVGNAFAKVYMTAYGGVPAPGLNIFPHGTLLEVDFSMAVEDMEMDNGMEDLGAIVGTATSDGAKDVALFINDGE